MPTENTSILVEQSVFPVVRRALSMLTHLQLYRQSSMQRSDLVQQVDHLAITELKDETMILDVESGQYFGLNQTGAMILNMTEDPIRVSTIVKRLQSSFDLTSDQAQRDTYAFLEEMESRGIIEQVDSASE